MSDKKLIVCKAYRRPIYLYRVLKSLAQCKSIENYRLLISIDGPLDPIQHQLYEATILSGIVNKIHVEMIQHSSSMGCAGHTKWLFEHSFSEQDFVIQIEDDAIVCKDWLEYIEYGLSIIDNKNLFAVCSFNRPCHQTELSNIKLPKFSGDDPWDDDIEAQKFYDLEEDLASLRTQRWFDGSGPIAFNRKSWNQILDKGGLFGVSYISTLGRTNGCQGEPWLKEISKSSGGSWVFPIWQYFSGGQKCLFPYISRSVNIGKVGLFCQNEEMHNALQYNPIMSDLWEYEYKIVNYSIMNDDRKFIENGIEE